MQNVCWHKYIYNIRVSWDSNRGKSQENNMFNVVQGQDKAKKAIRVVECKVKTRPRKQSVSWSARSRRG